MGNLIDFIREHSDEDVTRLVLHRDKWPDMDMEYAVNCILGHRKLKGKVARWASDPNLLCPSSLSAEQCSSDETGIYKAALAERIVSRGNWTVADLTGGLGIDTWYFSQKAGTVLYCEMQPVLAEAAAHNFKVLGADNVRVRNCAVVPESEVRDGVFQSPSGIFGDFRPDLIYMDPARRGEGGRKVFLLEDCTPDVLGLLKELWQYTDHILLKLSPMADISMVTARLGQTCREVHVVSSGGECKELLVWLDRNWAGKCYDTVVYESGALLHCASGAEAEAAPLMAGKKAIAALPEKIAGGEEVFLFEPGKALMKAGLFNYVSARYGLLKLGRSTHYYLLEDKDSGVFAALSGLGKMMRIKEVLPMNNRMLKDVSARYPHSELTARNLPVTTEILRKKMKLKSGDDAHIYALKTDAADNLLFVCQPNRVRQSE